MIERRRYERINTEDRVVIKSQDGSGAPIESGLVSISFVGLSVYAKEGIKPDVNVSLELKSKSWDKSVVGEGKVIHSEKIKIGDSEVFRIGIEFIKIDKKSLLFYIAFKRIFAQKGE